MRKIVTALFVVSALTLFACGGSESATPRTTKKPTTTTTTTTTASTTTVAPTTTNPRASSACPNAAVLNQLLVEAGSSGQGQVEDPVSCDGPWSLPTLADVNGGTGQAAFHYVDGQWAFVYASGSFRLFCDTIAAAGYTNDPDCAELPPATPSPSTSAASCADGSVTAVAEANKGEDPTATVDAVTFCDGLWAVVSISSDTYAYPLLLQAEEGLWVNRPREQQYCAQLPAEIIEVCQVS